MGEVNNFINFVDEFNKLNDLELIKECVLLLGLNTEYIVNELIRINLSKELESEIRSEGLKLKILYSTKIIGKDIYNVLDCLRFVRNGYAHSLFIDKNKLIFLWSRVGKFIFNLLAFVYKLSPNYLKKNVYLVEGWFLAIKHKKEIKAGNLEFFNKTLR